MSCRGEPEGAALGLRLLGDLDVALVAGGGRGAGGQLGVRRCPGVADVRQVRVRVVLVGQRLFARASAGQKLALLGVAPLHAPVLEPDLHLSEARRLVRAEGEGKREREKERERERGGEREK